MADFSQHTEGLRGVLTLDRTADPAQAERPESPAVLPRLADLATRLCDLQLRHPWFPRQRPAPPRREPEQPDLPLCSCAGTGSRGPPCRAARRPLRAVAGCAAR